MHIIFMLYVRNESDSIHEAPKIDEAPGKDMACTVFWPVLGRTIGFSQYIYIYKYTRIIIQSEKMMEGGDAEGAAGRYGFPKTLSFETTFKKMPRAPIRRRRAPCALPTRGR